jgi:serine/threonine-protein kinase HipA
MTPKKSERYDTSRPFLDVYLYDELVGYLGQAGSDVWFRYAEPVLATSEPQRHQLSVRLPVREEVYDHEATLAFFDNLLLESDTRVALARAAQQDQRDIPGLLGQVGSECAGAVALWPHGQEPPREGKYRSYSRAELGILFDEAHGEQLTKARLESRQSMSGVQDKLVFRKRGTSYDLPLAGAPGDVILKRPSRRYPGLVENEYACQRLVAALELGAAGTAALTGNLYLLESHRYDRSLTEDGKLRRLHQEDFCQALGRRPMAKYQRTRGPGFAELAGALRQYSAQPAADLLRLLRMAIVNLCLGNMDAHAKNFSLLYTEEGIRLSPFYDVVSTLAYPALAPSYSMYIGGASEPRELEAHAIERFARDLQVTAATVREAIGEVSDGMARAWPDVVSTAVLETGEAPVYREITAIIKTQSALVIAAAVKPSTGR